MKWGNPCFQPASARELDIPSYEMRERRKSCHLVHLLRYTLIWNEGTLSVYAVFSHLKYIVVQPTQKLFTILVTYLICLTNKAHRIFCGFLCFLFFFCKKNRHYKICNVFKIKRIRYRKICDNLFFWVLLSGLSFIHYLFASYEQIFSVCLF